MESVSVLVFFFLLLLVPEARSTNQRGCEPFTCGELDFKFPFFSTTMPTRCGLFKLNCSANISEIQLVEKGKWYKVKSVSQANTITITDTGLNQSLVTENCSDLSSFSLPDSPWLNLTTLYKCNNSRRKNDFIYANCGGERSSLYYSLGVGHDVSGCSAIKTPESWVTPRKGNQYDVNATFSIHIKLPQGCFRCHQRGGECKMIKDKYQCDGVTKEISHGAGAKIGSGVGVTLFLILVLTLFLQILRKRKTSRDLGQQNLKTLISQPKLKALIPLKQYSYAQVKRITKSFAEEVGRGGFGTVYRGTLCDGRCVAVKVLKDSKGNNCEDFINEVASMSQTSHVNIVTLLGFCSEGSKRAIIYEFLENGSLDKFISSKRSSNMDWRELYKIALGVARGLEYLHHGCRTRIVHFDIKPHNVLLDDNLVPKVSDFGLAKLCEKKESIVSLLDTRGTIGYIAPELFSRMYGRVSHKSDVYSYGMLVLEMIGASNKTSTDDSALNQSSMYFPEWIYKDLENQDNGRLIENGINSEEEEIAKKMTLVGLWCIQSSPSDRPPMGRVVEMMEGNLNALEVPPRPVFQITAAPLQESSTISEDISAYPEIYCINVA